MNPRERVRFHFVGQEDLGDAVELEEGVAVTSVFARSRFGDRISCRHGCWVGLGQWTLGLVKADAFMRILSAGIGENDLIARLETADDLDGVDRAAAKLHRRANRFG